MSGCANTWSLFMANDGIIQRSSHCQLSITKKFPLLVGLPLFPYILKNVATFYCLLMVTLSEKITGDFLSLKVCSIG